MQNNLASEYEARRHLVERARAMLEGNLPFLEGSQSINEFMSAAGVDDFDEDRLPFRVIVSETEQFPIAGVRQYWDPKTLANLQPEIDAAEEWAKETASAHCQSLIDRFGPEAVRRQIGQIARAMLDSKVSFIEGAHRIAFLREYAELPEFDPDLVSFLQVHTEYDFLPPSDGREYWTADVLNGKYPEIRGAEERARQSASSDCQRLIDRFIGQP